MYKTPLSGAEGGRANDLTLVIFFHKENAVSRNQDMEHDHNQIENNSFQNIWTQPSFRKKTFQNTPIVMILD